MPYSYVPLLKTRTGESTALLNLTVAEKARIFPVFHVGERPPTRFVYQMSNAWHGLPMALDGLFNYGHKGNLSDFTNLFSLLRSAGVHVMPSIEFNAPATYAAAVQSMATVTGGRIVVKTSFTNAPSVAAWAAAHEWTPKNIDLILDLKSILDYDHALLVDAVKAGFSKAIPTGTPWRSITLASSAAPKDASGIAIGRCLIPRRDWMLWNSVVPAAPFCVNYGDYAVSHPDLKEPPGVAMTKASVTVKYAIDDQWIMHRGCGTTGPAGQPMGIQYTAHAKSLASDPLFGTISSPCWGDGRISAIAAGASSAGGRSQWAEIATSRHISLVVDRLP